MSRLFFSFVQRIFLGYGGSKMSYFLQLFRSIIRSLKFLVHVLHIP